MFVVSVKHLLSSDPLNVSFYIYIKKELYRSAQAQNFSNIGFLEMKSIFITDTQTQPHHMFE